MKKTYLAPKAESINVETFIIAASTERGIKSSNADIGSSMNSANAARENDWGNIWNN